MRPVLLFLLSLCFSASWAQHCPWDCAGITMISTDLTRTEMKKLDPVLVDHNKHLVVDTMYGTGLATYDSCIFLPYQEFKAKQTDKIKIHHWYEYHAMLDFADGYYVVYYSDCRFHRQDLFIRYNDLEHPGQYKYKEIPLKNRVTPHDYASQLWAHDHQFIRKEVQPAVMIINNNQW